MPRLSEPVRLAVLADLHESLDEADRQKLVALVEEAAPDLILLDGDMLNGDSADAADVCTLTERLSQIAPVYCALGNHEIAYLEAGTSPLLEKLEQAGAAVLEQSFVDLKLGSGIRLGGLYEYAFAQDDFNTCDPDRMDPAVYGFCRTSRQLTAARSCFATGRTASSSARRPGPGTWIWSSADTFTANRWCCRCWEAYTEEIRAGSPAMCMGYTKKRA